MAFSLSNLSEVGKGALTVPAITAAVDGVRHLNDGATVIGEAMASVYGGVDSILQSGASISNPLLIPAAGIGAASLLTYGVLSDMGIEGKWKKIAMSAAAGGAAYLAGAAAVPYVVGSAAAYGAGKLAWKWGKKPMKALGKAIATPFVGLRGLGWGAIKGGAKGSVNDMAHLWKNGPSLKPQVGF